MIERFAGDPNVDLLPEIYLDGDPEDDAIAYSGMLEAPCANLFDDPDTVQGQVDLLSRKERKEKALQEQSKAEIERISALDAEERVDEGFLDSWRDFIPAPLNAKHKTPPKGLNLSAVAATGQDPLITARNDKVVKNLGLAISIARTRSPKEHLKKSDLLQLGVTGLMRAAEKYDPSKAAFSTYAYRWIKSKIQRGVDKTERAIVWTDEIEVHVRKVTHLINVVESGSHQMPIQPDELRTACAAQGDIEPERVEEYLTLPIADIGLDEIDELASTDLGYEEAENRVFASQLVPIIEPVLCDPDHEKEGQGFILYSLRNNPPDMSIVSFIEVGKQISMPRAAVWYNYKKYRRLFANMLTEQALGGDSSDLVV